MPPASPPDMMGFLFKKGEWNTAYHRRWFIRKGNMLFYLEECESQEPIGVIVLECCTVMLCKSAEELAFTIKGNRNGNRGGGAMWSGRRAVRVRLSPEFCFSTFQDWYRK